MDLQVMMKIMKDLAGGMVIRITTTMVMVMLIQAMGVEMKITIIPDLRGRVNKYLYGGTAIRIIPTSNPGLGT